MQCKPLTFPDRESNDKINRFLTELGVTPVGSGLTYPPSSYVVVFNGRVYGSIEPEIVGSLESAFRKFKSDGTIGEYTEFVFIPRVS